MTTLRKAVRREVQVLTDSRLRARERDQVIVTLYPNGTIGLRAKRTRREYTLALATVYTLAIRAHVDNEKREKAKAKREKSKLLA